MFHFTCDRSFTAAASGAAATQLLWYTNSLGVRQPPPTTKSPLQAYILTAFNSSESNYSVHTFKYVYIQKDYINGRFMRHKPTGKEL